MVRNIFLRNFEIVFRVLIVLVNDWLEQLFFFPEFLIDLGKSFVQVDDMIGDLFLSNLQLLNLLVEVNFELVD